MIYGVTLDSVSHMEQVVDSLQGLSQRPTVRVVFDEDVKPSNYSKALKKLSPVSDIMGEILDSMYVKEISVKNYKKRTQEYLDAFENTVTIWEIGNEINGEWLGDTKDVVAKMTAAHDLVKSRGKLTALTLYYNKECFSKKKNEMFTWADTNIPQDMKYDLDYVFVSYYEDDCDGPKPDWQDVFSRLGEMFPNSQIGIGECGTKKKDKKSKYIKRYYSMEIDHPRFIGGWFWWYYHQDMIDKGPLWRVLDDTIKSRS